MTSQLQVPSPQLHTWTTIAKEWIPLVGSFTTILIPVTWLIGRSHMIGYYQAFSIPIVQLNLSLSDYIENGWIPLIISLVFSIVLSAVILIYGLIVIPELRNMLLNPSQRQRWAAVTMLVVGIYLFWGIFSPHNTFGCASLLALVVIFAPRLVEWGTQFQQTNIARVIIWTGLVLLFLIPPVAFRYVSTILRQP